MIAWDRGLATYLLAVSREGHWPSAVGIYMAWHGICHCIARSGLFFWRLSPLRLLTGELRDMSVIGTGATFAYTMSAMMMTTMLMMMMRVICWPYAKITSLQCFKITAELFDQKRFFDVANTCSSHCCYYITSKICLFIHSCPAIHIVPEEKVIEASLIMFIYCLIKIEYRSCEI